MEDFISIGDAASHMGITRLTAYKMVDRGLLPITRIGRHQFTRVDMLPRVIKTSKRRMKLVYPDGYADTEVLKRAREQGYVK